jgi:hypothetical protein
MKRFRFRLGTLLLIVLLVGVGFAALRESNEIWDSSLFSITIGALLISILLAIHRPERRRAFWLGFALFGSVYLGLSLVPSIESRLITTKVLAYIDSKVPRSMPAGFAYADFDNDGTMDLYVVNQAQPNAVFVNKGNGTFQDVTATVGSSPVNQAAGSDTLYLNNTARLLVRGSVGTTENFMRIGHSLFALTLAFVGGQLSRCLQSRRLVSTSEPSSPTTGISPQSPSRD